MKVVFEGYAVELTPDGTGFKASLGDQVVEVEVEGSMDTGRLELRLNGRKVTAYVTPDGTKRWVTVDGQTYLLTLAGAAGERGGASREGALELTAPMPGQVRAVSVHEGDAVAKGQTLLVLEAMKMEIRVAAPRDAVVKSLRVKSGETVEREQVLIILEEA